MANKKVNKNSELMRKSELLSFISDNFFEVEVPGWEGKKISGKRMSLKQMLELQKLPPEKQSRFMLKHAFGFSDADLEQLEKEGDGIKLVQLNNAVNMVYRPSDETVKK